MRVCTSAKVRPHAWRLYADMCLGIIFYPYIYENSKGTMNSWPLNNLKSDSQSMNISI